LDRVRRPRVQITYDVETNGSEIKKELPFVLGVMADLTGDRQKDKPLQAFGKREFTDINPDNFDKVLKSSGAHLEFQVANKLEAPKEGEDATLLPFKMDFEQMTDFSPEQVAQSFGPTRELLQARMQMHNLLTRLEAQAEADSLLKRVIGSTTTSDGKASS
jgi:type VI secretion system protein ImpB